ncbi:hypothetical protein E6C27_scaffold89G003120 [Cucumis melo var. makuwa]|uniref:Uncharacterized protein n=1 Tax=Cucumis melo var. makuwa TaxID=1194695 RepID=A0A5A7V687_CUCMM|nr:hypothetical protein E6C27_scaffold89G003120 [Cucumis melo var. makuwa]
MIEHLRSSSPSAIQLLLEDDRTFTIKSITLVGTIRHLHSALPSAIQLLLGDDRTFFVRSTTLVRTIGHLRSTSPSAIQLLLELQSDICPNDRTSSFYFAVSDPTSTRGRLDICRQIHCSTRKDQVEVKLYRRHLIGEAEVELSQRDLLRAVPSSFWRGRGKVAPLSLSWKEGGGATPPSSSWRYESGVHHRQYLGDVEAKLHYHYHLRES